MFAIFNLAVCFVARTTTTFCAVCDMVVQWVHQEQTTNIQRRKRRRRWRENKSKTCAILTLIVLLLQANPLCAQTSQQAFYESAEHVLFCHRNILEGWNRNEVKRKCQQRLLLHFYWLIRWGRRFIFLFFFNLGLKPGLLCVCECNHGAQSVWQHLLSLCLSLCYTLIWKGNFRSHFHRLSFFPHVLFFFFLSAFNLLIFFGKQ